MAEYAASLVLGRNVEYNKKQHLYRISTFIAIGQSFIGIGKLKTAFHLDKTGDHTIVLFQHSGISSE